MHDRHWLKLLFENPHLRDRDKSKSPFRGKKGGGPDPPLTLKIDRFFSYPPSPPPIHDSHIDSKEIPAPNPMDLPMAHPSPLPPKNPLLVRLTRRSSWSAWCLRGWCWLWSGPHSSGCADRSRPPSARCSQGMTPNTSRSSARTQSSPLCLYKHEKEAPFLIQYKLVCKVVKI